ncbi:MAG TPA: hypothetical protein VMM56_15965 [Planctomycetaceae bacterium]|nr:hypothetical protein [Planctomycetaceae bacterium]
MSEVSPPVRPRRLWPVYGVLLGLIAAFAINEWQFYRLSNAFLNRREVGAGHETLELLSPTARLDRIYKSMNGPRYNHALIPVSTTAAPEETLWVTGIRTDLVDPYSGRVISKEFFCHANLTLNPETLTPAEHNQLFPEPKHLNGTLFTLVPGLMEIQLPEGFGIPVHGNSKLDCYLMALNQNPGLPDRSLRMKTRIDIQQDKPLKPLFYRTPILYQRYQEASANTRVATLSLPGGMGLGHGMGSHPGELCAPSCEKDQLGALPTLFRTWTSGANGQAHLDRYCCVDNASLGGILEQFGNDHTIHWMVPPGKHTYRAEVTQQLNLPFNTTAHYITGHLHPMGTRLVLRDLDTEATVFEIDAKCLPDRLGVLEMSIIKSLEGIPIYTDHRYELICDYDNTSNAPVDAMAVLYFYLLDEERSKPAAIGGTLLTRLDAKAGE